MEPVDSVLSAVRGERVRQDAKWGEQSYKSDEIWLATLTEEVGEVARELLDNHDDADHLREELVQVAAVAVAWIEATDKRGRNVALR